MTLAVVRSIGTPRRLTTAQEYEDFEQELVDQFLLAGVGAGMADGSIADDRRAIFEYARFLGRPVWTSGPEDADQFLAGGRTWAISASCTSGTARAAAGVGRRADWCQPSTRPTP